MQLQTPERERSPNPARARGLRRARSRRAPCEPAVWTPLPAPVDAAHLLALLTRERAARVAAGEIKPSRLYDVRAFKSVYAELGYLRRLAAAGKTGGTVVTSMPQLVKGLAPLHPAWTMDGDSFADRDRHQQAVRRRLRDLDAMGLLRWRVGIDVDGEDARTELELRPAPDVSEEELADAAAQLQRWRVRYGPALNTGSSTGIHNAAKHGRPLSARERQRRGIVHTRARVQSRRERSTSNSAPHFVASATPKNPAAKTKRGVSDHVGGLRTGVTRAHVSGQATPCSAGNEIKTAATKNRGPAGTLAGFEATRAARFERLAALRAARQPIIDQIAAQTAQRAADVAGWGLQRGWPLNRLREAFACWRWGAAYVAEHSWAAGAGRCEPGDREPLRRAATRYERHAGARPAGYPTGALAALAHIAASARADDHGERLCKPRTLHYAIRVLDQVSKRMRAIDTAGDARRRAQQAARARRRLLPADTPEPQPLAFRRDPASGESRPWPPWVALDDAGEPLLVDGELVHVDARIVRAPARHEPAYIAVLRDALLLAGAWLPARADGRLQMADNIDNATYDLTEGRRRALPGLYPSPQRRARPEPQDLELARLTGLALRDAQRLDSDIRDRLLAQLRAELARENAAAAAALWQRITAATDLWADSSDPEPHDADARRRR